MELLDFWQHFYERTERVAFCLGGVCVHYYAICYILALVFALFLAKRYARTLGISAADCDAFFIYVEICIILGARLGYVAIYSPERWWFFTHPWQIFNPFDASGRFVGIAGMSYHGACAGAIFGAWLFARSRRRFLGSCAKTTLDDPHGLSTRGFCSQTQKSPCDSVAKSSVKNQTNPLFWLDLVALSAPFAYTLGRVGNFLNHELFGRATDVPWGVYVGSQLRHPSQLYEALLEGVLVGICMHFYLRYRAKFSAKSAAKSAEAPGGTKAFRAQISSAKTASQNRAETASHNPANALIPGEFIALYAALYSLARFVCEFWREPDAQLGTLALGLSMGQWLSLALACAAAGVYALIFRKNHA